VFEKTELHANLLERLRMSENTNSETKFLEMTPKQFRKIVRRNEYVGPTIRVCRGSAQANLAAVPKEMAFEFLLFCNRNPRPCPVMDVTEPGDPHPRVMAPDADLRTDIPRYRVYENGKCIAEPMDVLEYWRDDLVGFLLGCSYGFDWSLQAANIEYRLIGAYTTKIECVPCGRLHGPMVVSSRVFKNSHDAIRATQISSRFPLSHGGPIHVGDPGLIGIESFQNPDVAAIERPMKSIGPKDVILHHGCGITPQAIAMRANIPFMITHYPANMFVTDKRSEELSVL